ncbi:IS630 family transposase, partial [Pseudomonas syringae pv. actinidiae]|nr:IS630 family transposase [Pseudomonas syringae pv. actinidiae]NVL37568.1 IS630 family transposase [Pseudomonas syringae pv. actinidiae]NVL37933.1 IS630 family transposase [Pseudomonas syringae pv. actinidiae]NVL37937.1 IS630 family transposase [Pseudomonas syringae pv. actinidiae]
VTSRYYLRDGSFSSIRELESSITTFLALRNAQPTRYVWNAKGEDILNKIQRARVGDEHAGMREVNFETVH